MRSKRCSRALVTGTTLLVMLGTALTGSSKLDAETISQAADQSQQVQVNPVRKVIRVDFPGGTCGEYVDLLRKGFPEQSVVLTPGVAGFKLPPINVAIGSILPGLKLACGIEGELIYQDQDDAAVKGTLEYERISEGLWRIVGKKTPQENTSRGRSSRPVAQQSSGTFLKAYAAHDLIKSGLTIEGSDERSGHLIQHDRPGETTDRRTGSDHDHLHAWQHEPDREFRRDHLRTRRIGTPSSHPEHAKEEGVESGRRGDPTEEPEEGTGAHQETALRLKTHRPTGPGSCFGRETGSSYAPG